MLTRKNCVLFNLGSSRMAFGWENVGRIVFKIVLGVQCEFVCKLCWCDKFMDVATVVCLEIRKHIYKRSSWLCFAEIVPGYPSSTPWKVVFQSARIWLQCSILPTTRLNGIPSPPHSRFFLQGVSRSSPKTLAHCVFPIYAFSLQIQLLHEFVFSPKSSTLVSIVSFFVYSKICSINIPINFFFHFVVNLHLFCRFRLLDFFPLMLLKVLLDHPPFQNLFFLRQSICFFFRDSRLALFFQIPALLFHIHSKMLFSKFISSLLPCT